ncbi:MAG: glutathione S-transferase family protein [Pseudomonadota bacterium]
MTALALYQNPASPFARKARVVISETGQDDEIAQIEVIGSPTAKVAAGNPNPIGKIPSLTRADGPTLFDSRVICRFLNARAGAVLYPDNRIWDVLTVEALADGILDAAVAMVYEKRCRPEEKWSEDWLEGQWSKVERGLTALESQWISHLSGPLDIGQIGVGCALGYLDFRHPDRNWRQGRDTLVAWERRFAERPSMQATRPS